MLNLVMVEVLYGSYIPGVENDKEKIREYFGRISNKGLQEVASTDTLRGKSGESHVPCIYSRLIFRIIFGAEGGT